MVPDCKASARVVAHQGFFRPYQVDTSFAMHRKLTLALAFLALAAAACGDDIVKGVNEPYQVVDGTPRVERGLPVLEDAPPDFDPRAFGSNTPSQVDLFRQLRFAKTDILWQIDNTPTMSDEQSKLAQNFESFIRYLTQADPPVDFHLGIITNDLGAAGPILRQVPGNVSRFIACDVVNNTQTCNVGTSQQVVDAFKAMVKVGTTGFGIEHNFMNIELALTPPLLANGGANDGFLRADASLFIIDVSDEDDMSCDALNVEGPGVVCRNSPYCGCRDDGQLSVGKTTYYARFIEGLKGFGREHLVTYAAIGAPNDHELQAGSGYFGCGDLNGQFGLWAKRREAVATATGGTMVDICSADYTPALEALGFAVSGLKSEFPLSRKPYENTLQVRITLAGSTTSTPLARMSGTTKNWEYILCNGARQVNSIRFYGAAIPAPNSTIEVEYSVNVRGPTCP